MKTKTARTLGVLFATCCLIAALTAVAQAPPGGPGRGHGPGPGVGAADSHRGPAARFERLARYLELSDEQIAAAKAIRADAKAQIEPIREAQKAIHDDLKALLDGTDPDPAAVGELVIQLHQGRERVRAIHEASKAAFEALLTPEQLEKLARLKSVRAHFGQPSWGDEGEGEGAV